MTLRQAPTPYNYNIYPCSFGLQFLPQVRTFRQAPELELKTLTVSVSVRRLRCPSSDSEDLIIAPILFDLNGKAAKGCLMSHLVRASRGHYDSIVLSYLL